METSVHRELKQLYAGAAARTEVRLGRYRIDAVDGETLIEVQFASLSAIRGKVSRLLKSHQVRIVKPIIASKTIIRRATSGGAITSRRRSPKRGRLLNLFDELIYFTRVFPHPRLTIEFVLIDILEERTPGHGRRRRWRRNDHVVADQQLVSIGERLLLATNDDLLAMMPVDLPRPFHTGHLADQLQIPRHEAQRMAYCLRQVGAIRTVGKSGNTRLYEVARDTRSRRRRAS